MTSDTHIEHLKVMRQLFERFRTHNLKCRLSKLQIARGQIDYLGYSISAQHGIRAGEAKLKSSGNGNLLGTLRKLNSSSDCVHSSGGP